MVNLKTEEDQDPPAVPQDTRRPQSRYCNGLALTRSMQVQKNELLVLRTSSSFFCTCQSISSSLNLSRTKYQPALVAQLVESLVRRQQVRGSIPPLDKKNLVATLLSLRDVLKPRLEFHLRQWRGTPSACSPHIPQIFHWVTTCMTRSAREFSTTQT